MEQEVPQPPQKKRGRPRKKVQIIPVHEEEEELQIPLSDGANLEQEIDEEELAAIEEEIIQRQEEEEEAALQAKQEARKNIGRSIADEIAKKTVNRTINSFVKVGKEQEKLTKTVLDSEFMEPEYINGCVLMNAYRVNYKDKIPFNFKKNYEPGPATPPQLVRAHLQEVRTILNSEAVPYFLTQLLDKGSEMITKASVLSNIPWLNFKNLHSNMKAAMSSGFFDEEIKQLSVELMGMLGQSPGKRLAWKIAMVVGNTWFESLPESYLKKQTSNFQNIPQEKVKNLSNQFTDI